MTGNRTLHSESTQHTKEHENPFTNKIATKKHKRSTERIKTPLSQVWERGEGCSLSSTTPNDHRTEHAWLALPTRT